jgi:hypothetical protein
METNPAPTTPSFEVDPFEQGVYRRDTFAARIGVIGLGTVEQASTFTIGLSEPDAAHNPAVL